MAETGFDLTNLRPTLCEMDVAEGHTVRLDRLVMTPEMARDLLATCAYPRQRQAFVTGEELYADMMVAGDFLVTTIMVADYTGPATAELSPGRYLLNGYHRLAGVVRSGTTLVFLCEQHRVADPDLVHRLYSVQDRGRSRSISDVFRSLGLDAVHSLSIKDLRSISEAAPHILNGFTMRRKAQTDAFARALFVKEWIAEGRRWSALLHSSPNRLRWMVSASPITAVFLVALRHQPERAVDFIGDVMRDDGLKAGSPAKATIDWIVDHRVRAMPEHEYARHIAAGWNAFFEDRPLERVLVRDLTASIRIAGTPYTGKQQSGAAGLPIAPLIAGRQSGADAPRPRVVVKGTPDATKPNGGAKRMDDADRSGAPGQSEAASASWASRRMATARAANRE